MKRMSGQSMVEYLVVAAALIGAFYWTANADCPGYANCLSKLKTVMHDKYEGYAHSISAVHQYGDLKAEPFGSSWGEPESGDGDGGVDGGGGGDIPEAEGLQTTNLLKSPGGDINYGTLLEGQYLVDEDGVVIGTYDGDSGILTYEGGGEVAAVVDSVVTDEDGNEVTLQAAVDCVSGDVYGFGYTSGVTGDFHDALVLEVTDVDGLCKEDTGSVVDEDGNDVNGVIVGSDYYASEYANNIDSKIPLTPNGEVVYFNITVPDEDAYSDSDPGVGELVSDCAVMISGWDSDPDKEPLDVYLNSDPSYQIGSMDPDSPMPCPTDNEVVD